MTETAAPATTLAQQAVIFLAKGPSATELGVAVARLMARRVPLDRTSRDPQSATVVTAESRLHYEFFNGDSFYLQPGEIIANAERVKVNGIIVQVTGPSALQHHGMAVTLEFLPHVGLWGLNLPITG